MTNCIFTIGSVTQSMKATKILQANSIPVSSIKLSNSNARIGCVYGIEFNCRYTDNIRRFLSAANVRYEEYQK